MSTVSAKHIGRFRQRHGFEPRMEYRTNTSPIPERITCGYDGTLSYPEREGVPSYRDKPIFESGKPLPYDDNVNSGEAYPVIVEYHYTQGHPKSAVGSVRRLRDLQNRSKPKVGQRAQRRLARARQHRKLIAYYHRCLRDRVKRILADRDIDYVSIARLQRSARKEKDKFIRFFRHIRAIERAKEDNIVPIPLVGYAQHTPPKYTVPNKDDYGIPDITVRYTDFGDHGYYILDSLTKS